MTKRSITNRGIEIINQMKDQYSAAELVLKHLDLQDQVESLQHRLYELQRQEEWPEVPCSITIEEFSNSEGYLIEATGSPARIAEMDWISTVKQKSGLDVRAIVGDLPTELGLYSFKIVYKADGYIKQGSLKVWVVPVSSSDID